MSLTLDGALDGKSGLLGGEFEEFIDERKELLGLGGGNLNRGLAGGLGWRGGLGLRGGCGELPSRLSLLRRGCHCRRKAQRQRQTPCATEPLQRRLPISHQDSISTPAAK